MRKIRSWLDYIPPSARWFSEIHKLSVQSLSALLLMDIKYSSKGAGGLICCLEIICLLSKGRLPIRQSQLTKSGAGRSLILTVIIFFLSFQSRGWKRVWLYFNYNWKKKTSSQINNFIRIVILTVSISQLAMKMKEVWEGITQQICMQLQELLI